MKDLSLGQLKSYFSKRFEVRHRSRNPARDWTIILASALFVALCFVALATWMYLRVSAGDFSAAQESAQATLSIDRSKLSDVLGKWQLRANEYQKAIVDQPVLPDPKK